MIAPADLVDACRALIAERGATRLATRVSGTRRSALTIADGYVPMLVDYTDEDREAKGLRSLQGARAPRVPLHDSVLEAAAREPLLLLTGESGCGKTTALLHLALHLAGEVVGDARWNVAGLARPVPRNDAGDVAIERWSGPMPAPLPMTIESPTTLAQLLATCGPRGARVLDGSFECLLLIDAAEHLGDAGPALLADVAALVRDRPSLRVIVAGDPDVCRTWRLPAGFVHRRIVPLLASQRAAFADLIRPAVRRTAPADDREVTGNAGLWTLALEAAATGSSTDVVDRWLAEAAARNAIDVETLVGATGRDIDAGDRQHLRQPFLRRQLEARLLRDASIEEVVRRYVADPLKASGSIRLLARRLAAEGRPLAPLVGALLQAARPETAGYGALDAMRIADLAPPGTLPAEVRGSIHAALVTVVTDGRLPVPLRAEAARAVAIAGDPRDLDALIAIPGGDFTMGSTAHANSSPLHVVTVAAYRIGRYPVTNDRYRRFVEATGRDWASQDGLLPHRSNSPAVDLTWHDARAYCVWLDERWRAAGQIASHDVVRLPTEAEWERAARGGSDDDGLVYPWSGPWRDDAANSEEAGFNDTCAVGLFPLGRSNDGCDDLAGQVWEWTSTLWGEDMAAPRFRYPYRDDGREDATAPPAVRRVLRGACFLSPREKANGIYRGSLEPDGYWRGNGFRIVVAPR